MRRPGLVVGAVALAAIAFLVWLALRGGVSGAEARVQQEQRAAAESVTVARADAESLRTVADSFQREAVAAKDRERTALASADAKARRIVYLLAHPVTIEYAVTPGDSGPPLPQIDTVSSCEERYTLRTGEAADLRVALAACDSAGASEVARADRLSTATGRLMGALQASDSARRAEIIRPRPCRRNLVVAHPGCGLLDVVTLGLGFVLGVVVTR